MRSIVIDMGDGETVRVTGIYIGYRFLDKLYNSLYVYEKYRNGQVFAFIYLHSFYDYMIVQKLAYARVSRREWTRTSVVLIPLEEFYNTARKDSFIEAYSLEHVLMNDQDIITDLRGLLRNSPFRPIVDEYVDYYYDRDRKIREKKPLYLAELDDIFHIILMLDTC